MTRGQVVAVEDDGVVATLASTYIYKDGVGVSFLGENSEGGHIRVKMQLLSLFLFKITAFEYIP